MALGTRWILLAIGVATLGGCRAIVLDRASVQNVVTTSAPQRFSFDTQLSPKEIAARKLFSAMDRGDTKALLSMADPVEVRLLQLSEKNLKPLVDMYVAEKKKVRSLGITECQAAAREGAQCIETLRSQRTDFTISAMVYEADDHTLRGLVTGNLIGAIQAMIWDRTHDRPQLGPEVEFRLETTKLFQRELAPKGIGCSVFLSGEDGRVKGVSWKELIRRQEERLKDPIYATHYLGRREGL